jgi:hypothetical protein
MATHLPKSSRKWEFIMELAIDYGISVQSALNNNKQVHNLSSEEALLHSVERVVLKYWQELHRINAMG